MKDLFIKAVSLAICLAIPFILIWVFVYAVLKAAFAKKPSKLDEAPPEGSLRDAVDQEWALYGKKHPPGEDYSS